MDRSKTIEIYSGTLWEAEILKTMLASVNIQAYLKNHIINSYAFDPVKTGAVQVVILEPDYNEAIAIVNEFKQSSEG